MTAGTQSRAERSISHALPVFNVWLPARVVDQLVRVAGSKRYYDRVYSPLVVVWCLIFQRLNADHTCDAVVSHVAGGAVDHLGAQHKLPISARIRSESTAAYCKARKRLAISVLMGVMRHLADVAGCHLPSQGRWMGRIVAILDGTTVMMRPESELVKEYGQASNQHGVGYWATMRVVAAFCLNTAAIRGVKEGSYRTSEQELAKSVLAQLEPNSVVVGDRGFGVFSVAQAARHHGHDVLLRLTECRALAIIQRKMRAAENVLVYWKVADRVHRHPDMSDAPIRGRLLYQRIERPGFRPVDMYLFTTLLDSTRYSPTDLARLYARRWNVEIDLRYVKATLDMNMLTSKTKDMIRKELYAGLAAYNAVRAAMQQAAQLLNISALELSFAKCWRRLSETMRNAGLLDHVAFMTAPLRFEGCKLVPRPAFRIEPRAVRRRPAVYPSLKGDRQAARQQTVEQMRSKS